VSTRPSSWTKGTIKELQLVEPDFSRVNFALYYHPFDYYFNTYCVNSQNIFISVLDNPYGRYKKDDSTPRFRWQTVEQLVSVTSVFAEPTAEQVFKESGGMIVKILNTDKWSQKKKLLRIRMGGEKRIERLLAGCTICSRNLVNYFAG
jgi:hypothetical protein